jgi:hypothetical protein
VHFFFALKEEALNNELFKHNLKRKKKTPVNQGGLFRIGGLKSNINFTDLT